MFYKIKEHIHIYKKFCETICPTIVVLTIQLLFYSLISGRNADHNRGMLSIPFVLDTVSTPAVYPLNNQFNIFNLYLSGYRSCIFYILVLIIIKINI